MRELIQKTCFTIFLVNAIGRNILYVLGNTTDFAMTPGLMVSDAVSYLMVAIIYWTVHTSKERTNDTVVIPKRSKPSGEMQDDGESYAYIGNPPISNESQFMDIDIAQPKEDLKHAKLEQSYADAVPGESQHTENILSHGESSPLVRTVNIKL